MVVVTWYLELQLPMQSVPITTYVVSWNPAKGEVYSIQHYVIKFVSDLQQVNSNLCVLRFPKPIKLNATILTEILLKVALTLTSNPFKAGLTIILESKSVGFLPL